jgi:hypothetical protein
MRIKRWEIATVFAGLAFACIFLFSNVWGVGIALVCADALWLLTRIEIIQRPGSPGQYATLRGRLGLVRLILVCGVYAAVIYGTFIIRHDISPNTRVATVADFALAGLAFMLLGELRRSGNDMLNWIFGARAEKRVGASLSFFGHRGWFVAHCYPKDWGGDIDHVVCGPGGAYAIETKSYGFRSRDLRQTRSSAWWLREKLQAPWVTGVLCVAEDRDAEQMDKVWVVGHAQLVPWLMVQKNQPVDAEAARRILSEAFEPSETTSGTSAQIA